MRPNPVDVITRTAHYESFTMGGAGYNENATEPKAALGPAAAELVGLGLSTRRNLCTHPTVSQEATREATDRACRELTAPWVREREGRTVTLTRTAHGKSPRSEGYGLWHRQGSVALAGARAGGGGDVRGLRR
jgi:hypothetical protein